jgi:hypothetical protein
MRAFLEIIFDWIFRCHHRRLSRVFTIDRQTTECVSPAALDCIFVVNDVTDETETPQSLGSFAAAFTRAVNNLRDQSPGT